MYKSKPTHGKTSYCPVCHQFGKPSSGPVDGKTRVTHTPIIICTTCAAAQKTKRPHRDLPGQGKLFPE